MQDEKGETIYDRKGKPLILTDGTGYVSADIASKCPGSIFKGNCTSSQVTEVCDLELLLLGLSIFLFHILLKV